MRMKRITILTMLVALFSVTAFAQKGMKMQPFCGKLPAPSVTFQGLTRQAQPATGLSRRVAAEPPATAIVETWYTTDGKFYLYSSGWNDFTSDMNTIKVAIDGSDIYIQGLAYWFNEAWVQGTINGTTATFANNQLLGEDSYGAEYLTGSDDSETISESIVFNYDATEGVLSAVTKFLIENSSTTEISPYCYWLNPTFSKTEPVKPEVVVVPEGLTINEYVMTFKDFNENGGSRPLKIGISGSSVYVQGFSGYLPEAWIVGTLEGTTLTFAGKQYLGNYLDTYDIYLQDEDMVLTYNEDAGAFVGTGVFYAYTGSQYTDYYANPVITRTVVKVATPATPTISEVEETKFGPAVNFIIPVVDTDGNGILSSKLSYQFFVDVEQEVSPLTFKAADYTKLEEDMTVIPYGFTEDYDFFDNWIYLNMDEYDTFNKIGIQSIYTGGGEEKKSEIFWYTIKEYGNVSFNFNAMDVVCSTGTSSAGDINEDTDFTAGSITLTVSPSGAGTANRFWSTNNGPQLRVYGGTLTFKATADKVITKITFNNSRWNAGNSADTGTFEGNVWMGEAQKVVVTIAANSQLNSIDVETADFIPTPVVAPENLVTELYIFSAMALENGEDEAEAYSYQTPIGFDGDDLYINGLSSETADMWLKATKNAEGKYVIPANQFMGTYDVAGLGIWVFDYFLAAMDEEGKATDVVLTFDAENGKLTTDQTVVLNGSLTEWDPYQTFTQVSFNKFVEVAATPADPVLEKINFDSNYPNIYCAIPTVGTNGEELNAHKLFYTVWIEKDGQQQPYVFTAAKYADDFEEDMTEIPYLYDGYDLYSGGEIIYFEEEEDELSSWTKVGIQSIYYGAGECHKSNVVWLENATDTGISDVRIELNADKAVIYNLAGQRLNAPQKGLNIINGRKVMIK